jgi:hypothetical protein
MPEFAADTNPIETREDVVKPGEPSGEVRFWLQQLKFAEKEDRQWVKRGRQIIKRYRDERGNMGRRGARFNILWSNVETLRPILYGRTPKPDVERRHKNDDFVARLGADIIERALGYEDDLDEFDEVMQAVVEDRLLPGRGVARVYYEPEYGDPEDDPDPADEDDDEGDGDDKDQPKQFQPVVWERAPVRYIFWEDYRESPARTEREVWWKAYRSYLTRDELIERFGKEIGKKITLDYTPKGMGEGDGDGDRGPQADAFKKAETWEIWDKRKKQTVWIAPSYTDEVCDKRDDPYGLPDFFPSPEALRATTTNETRVPVADYREYQDQAVELDILTARIDKLQGALKVAGVYAASEKASIQQLVDENTENRLIPVEDWAMFTDKGGLQGLILWLPIEQIAKVLIQLYDARDRVQKTLYQITGMADILRGETDPNETLGAQQLKSQFATRRISRAQKQVAMFARNLMRLRGFIIAKHFSPDTLSQMTGLPEPLPQLPPPPPQVIPMQQAQAMLGQAGPAAHAPPSPPAPPQPRPAAPVVPMRPQVAA